MLQPSLASLAATLVRIRLSFAAWIEAESLFSAAVAASTPSAWPLTRTVRMVSRLGIRRLVLEVGEISAVHRADQRTEAIEIVAIYAVPRGITINRRPGNRAPRQPDRPIGR